MPQKNGFTAEEEGRSTGVFPFFYTTLHIKTYFYNLNHAHTSFFSKKHICKNLLNIDDIYKNTILMYILPSTIYLVQGWRLFERNVKYPLYVAKNINLCIKYA